MRHLYYINYTIIEWLSVIFLMPIYTVMVFLMNLEKALKNTFIEVKESYYSNKRHYSYLKNKF